MECYLKQEGMELKTLLDNVSGYPESTGHENIKEPVADHSNHKQV